MRKKITILTIGFLLVSSQVWAHPDPEPVSPEVGECFGQESKKYKEITPDLERALIAECQERVRSTAAKEPPKTDVEPASAPPEKGEDWTNFFSDDFESQLAYSWNFFGDWALRDDGTKTLEIGGKIPFSTSAGSDSWTDYELAFRYKPLTKVETANLRIQFRIDWARNKYYSLILSPGNDSLILEKTINESTAVLQSTSYAFEKDQWHDVVIRVVGDGVWISVNGTQVINIQDKESPLLFGRIGIMAEFATEAIARIDDVQVTGIYEKPEWEHLGAPFGGKVAKILIDPKNPNTILLTAEHASVYKSTDGGLNWKPAFKGLNTVDLLVKGFVMSPHDPKIVLAMSSDGAYRTTDEAETWRKISNITSPDSEVRGSGRFAFSPSDSKIVYMGTDRDIEEDGVTKGGLFLISKDAGASFAAVLASTFNKNVRSMAVHPSNPETVFVGTKHEGLWKTTDGGKAWQEKNSGLDYKNVSAIEINPSNPNQMFAIAGELMGSSFLYRSENGGDTWVKENITLDGEEYRGIVMVKFAPSDPRQIFVLGGGILFTSTDGGKNWSQKEVSAAYQPFDIAVDPLNPSKLVVGYYNGVMITNDGGASWQRSVQGLGAHGIISLAVDPTNPAIVYAGDWSYGGIHKSVDSGKTWTSVNVGLGEGIISNVQDITVDSKNPQTVYAGLYDRGVFKSMNGGGNWTSVSNGLTSLNVAQVVVSPMNSDVLYAATTERVNYFDKSEQSGALYGLYKSTDGGANWTNITAGLDLKGVQSIALHPTNPNIVYIGTALQGVYKTLDGGQSWAAKNSGFSSGDDFIQAIVINPKNPDMLYAGIDQIYKSRWAESRTEFVTGGGAVYKSTDGGETWTKTALDESIAAVEKLVIDPANPSTVYVSTHSPGVYKSVDAGAIWLPMNMGMLYLDESYGGHNYVFALESSADGTVLYAGGCGRGVFKTATLLEDAEAPPSAAEVETVQETKKFPLIIVLVSAAVITALGALVAWIIFKKKKSLVH